MRAATTLVGAAVALNGCVSFVPRQNADIIKHLNTVQDQLSTAKTTLTVDSGAGYAKLEPFYIGALSSADQAQAAAESRAAYSEGKLPAVPARNAALAIKSCRDQIERDRAELKATGVPPDEATARLPALMKNCTVATIMEEAYRQ